MRKFVVSGFMLFMMVSICSPSGHAASRGTNFSCDVAYKVCSCNVNIPGDCDAMKKNCKDGTIGECNPVKDQTICVCRMAIGVRDSGKAGQKKPSAVSE